MNRFSEPLIGLMLIIGGYRGRGILHNPPEDLGFIVCLRGLLITVVHNVMGLSDPILCNQAARVLEFSWAWIIVLCAMKSLMEVLDEFSCLKR